MNFSKRKDLCLVYNFAQHYRTNIFKLMDQTFHCDFVFGNTQGDIKKIDYSLLTNVKEVEKVYITSNWYYQRHVVSLVNKYKKIFVLGDVHCISTWILIFVAHLFGTHVYFWTHGWYGKESKMTALLKKLYFKQATGIFLYGNHARNLMIKEGFDENKMFVIYNSLDYDHQIGIRKSMKISDIYLEHFKNDSKNLIFIGRLTEVKRLDLLISSMKKLIDAGQKVNLTLIGDGTMKEPLSKKVSELGIESSVWFYGACYDEEKLSSLIYNADLCVSPGNVGLTAIHSMTFGTPVISHDSFKWQMPEFEAIEKGHTGDFFEYENLESLTETIERWFKAHNDDREEVRKACYDVIDSKFNPHYQIEVMKKHLL